MLDDIFDKINSGIENATTRVVNEPGKVVVDVAETLTGQNQPLNPVGWVTNAIRSGVGNSMLKGNNTILTDPRNIDGSFKTSASDLLWKITPEKKEARAKTQLENDPKYKRIRNAGYEFLTDDGRIKSNSEIQSALDITGTDEFNLYKATGGDTTKLDLSNLTTAELTKLTEIQDAKNTVERLGETGAGSGLSGQQIIGLADELTTKRDQKNKANDPVNAAQIRASEASIRQADERTKLDILGLQNELALGQSDIDLKKATALMQADQARLDREYLDRRDQRDYDYRIRKDDQERMDDIFKLLLGATNNLF